VRLTALALLLSLAAGALPAAGDDPAYRAAVQQWRDAREARLRSDGSWLTLAGLFWLKQGANRFGSDKDNDLVFPAGAPAHAGVLELKDAKTIVRLEPGVSATLAGAPVTGAELKADDEALVIGRMTVQVIARGGRYGVRLRNNDSPTRRDFQGLQWYPIQESYRVTARFVPLPSSSALEIPNVLGQVERLSSPGYAVFTLNGKELRLQPVLEEAGAKNLFFIFRDETAGKETYGSGRFLYSELPKNGEVVLDFNEAYTPPCAFTPYATCPLPPKENRLAARIEAGEKTPPGHAAARH
jgi:uncharacterized protein (DUF1684 family)